MAALQLQLRTVGSHMSGSHKDCRVPSRVLDSRDQACSVICVPYAERCSSHSSFLITALAIPWPLAWEECKDSPPDYMPLEGWGSGPGPWLLRLCMPGTGVKLTCPSVYFILTTSHEGDVISELLGFICLTAID